MQKKEVSKFGGEEKGSTFANPKRKGAKDKSVVKGKEEWRENE